MPAVGGDPFDSTRKMALWSVVPAEKADCYRKVTVEYVAAGIMERKYTGTRVFTDDRRKVLLIRLRQA